MRKNQLLGLAGMLGSLGLLAGAAGLSGAAEKPAAAGTVRIEVGSDAITFAAGDDLVGRYVIGPDVAKPYFWPLHAPGGLAVTRGWPMAPAGPADEKDHPHQKSAWFCHGDVIPEGIALKDKVRGVAGVDFWSETRGHGRIVCTRVGEVTHNKTHGKVVTFNTWQTADGTKVLDETRVLHLHDFGEARLLVLDIDLHATAAPITFGDTKEGSMGVRVRGTITEKRGAGRITNAEGKTTEKEVWGLQSAWCDYSGPAEGKTAGISLFADPRNPSPSCWHARGYGLMAANPFGRSAAGFPATKGRTDLVKLAKGDHLKLRFGILLHTGDVKQARVAEYYERFRELKGA